MALEIRMLTLGMVATNCYIIGDTETGEAVLIDPVDNADLLMQTVQDAGWTLKLILATHGHFDHVLASKDLKAASDAPFAINEREMVWLNNMPQRGVYLTGQPFPEAAQPDRFLTDEPETIEVGAIRLETLFTPGHAPGHLCFYMREHQVLFCGDCVFQGSIGRTDLPESNYDILMRSIRSQILTLGDEVTLLSGHGGQTTIGEERRTNPFLQE